MKVRVTYRMEVFVEGENLDDAVNEFQNLNLETRDVVERNGGFVEIVSVEDCDTGEDYTNDF